MESSINSILVKLAIATRIANENAMSAIGIHSGQAQVLSLLSENDGQSQAQLLRSLGVSAPTVNKIVGKLSENGFVKTRKCPEDNRLMRVHLTAKGARVQPRIDEQQKRLEDMILMDFSETEKVLIKMLLERLYMNLLKNMEPNT
ncbi:MAG: MarR family transcriptional regulator [Acidobacteria bacterium]|nr:MarR family transcriptional regulator [Acidobacteriota bacterium]